MNPSTETDVVAVLEDGRQDFLSATQGLSDAQAATPPAPERWSVLECMEHIVIVEERFLGWLDAGKPLEKPAPDREKEISLMARVMDRSTRAQAPEVVRPQGRWATLAAATGAFNAIRDRSVRTARERGAGLYAVAVEHPRFGPMNGIELLHVIAGHARRHAQQIGETREALGV